MNNSSFIIAAGQMTSTENVAHNLQVCHELAASAADSGAKLLALPECFGFLGLRERDKFDHAESLHARAPGPIVHALTTMARTHNLWIVAGGLPEQASPTQTYNTCAVVSPTGELAAAYRKIHLFDVEIPNRVSLRESDTTARGDKLVALQTPLGCLGLSICYDLRFPELYRRLVLDHGAQLLFVPAAFTAHTGAAHWHTLLRARAIENQCFVIAPAQVGAHNDKRTSYGHTLIVDPWGEVIAERSEGTGIATATIDLQQLHEVRTNMPCGQHEALVHDA